MKLSRKELRKYRKEVIPDYALHLFGYWWLILFGVLASILGVLGDMGLQIPSWVWWVVAAASIFIAQFLVWDAMRRERDRLRRYDVTQAALDKLAQFRDALIEMQNEPIKTDVEFGAWRERYFALQEEITEYINDNVTPAEAKLFRTKGIYVPLVISGKEYAGVDHIDIAARIIRDHQWLDKAVQDYSRKRDRPEMLAVRSAEQDATTDS